MLFSTHGVTNRYPIALELIFVIDVVGQCLLGIAVPQYLGHILANELKKQPKRMCRILVYI